MNALDAVVTRVVEVRYDKFGRWWVDVEYDRYGRLGGTSILCQTMIDALSVRIGCEFHVQ